jgi:hypothetical protein
VELPEQLETEPEAMDSPTEVTATVVTRMVAAPVTRPAETAETRLVRPLVGRPRVVTPRQAMPPAEPQLVATAPPVAWRQVV